MAHLLGLESSIESLQRDVEDIQTVVDSSISRCGPCLSLASWKFPDKPATQLCMPQLLSTYSFSKEDDVDNQISHISLLELVIDRHLLLQHLAVKFLNSILEPIPNRPESTKLSISISVGLVAKKFWRTILKLAMAYEQLEKEVNEKINLITDLRNNIGVLTKQNAILKSQAVQNAEIFKKSTQSAPVLPEVVSISKDIKSTASQTHETSFVACHACFNVQSCFIKTANCLQKSCSSVNIPSKMKQLRNIPDEPGAMNEKDVSRWSSELQKDLERLALHCQSLDKKNHELTEQITHSQSMLKISSDEVKNAKDELVDEKQKHISVVNEVKMRGERAVAQLHEELSNSRREFGDLEVLKSHVDEQLSNTESSLQQTISEKISIERDYNSCLKKLSKITADLNSEKRHLLASEKTCDDLKLTVTQLKSEVDIAEDSLKKEQLRNTSSKKLTESLQTRTDSLILRLDELDEENESLRNQLAEMDDVDDIKSSFAEKQNQMEETIRKQKIELKSLTEEKVHLEYSLKASTKELNSTQQIVAELKEREQLLIAFPDMTLIDKVPMKVPPNIAPDSPEFMQYEMQQQIAANETRILKLQEFNASLKASLNILIPNLSEPTTNTPHSEPVENEEFHEKSAPVQLFKPSDVPPQVSIEDKKTRSTAEELWLANRPNSISAARQKRREKNNSMAASSAMIRANNHNS